LARLHDRTPSWSANRPSRRRRAREHRRKELVEFQLATLDAELSTRFDNVIRTNDHNSNVQLPDVDFSPLQMVKWQASVPTPVHSPTTRLQPVSDANWSRLKINFSPPLKASSPLFPSPPISLLTAAELGLLLPPTPKVCLPEP
jgi:hypothetical protein